MENTEEDERVVEFNCGIVPSELIADSDCESDSSTDDDTDLEELRLIQLINSKVSYKFFLEQRLNYIHSIILSQDS